MQERLINLGSAFKFWNVLRSLGPRRAHGRAFVDWQTYYGAYLGSEPVQALIQHSVPLVGDDVRRVELINGMAAGHRAALVWAPPGCGKSRFALELARRLEKGRDRWEVLFVRHDEAAVREELNELSELKRVVLIVDDAQDCPALVEILGALAADSSGERHVHLVCITRSIGRADVTRSLNKVLPPGVIQELDLGRPSSKLVRNLLDQLLPKSSPMHRDTIERFVRQSYFGAVFVATRLSRERKLPQSFQRQYLRDQVCRQPLLEPTRDVCPMETAVRALAVFAALAPFVKQDSSIREIAAQLSGLTVERVELLLDRVLTAGLFQEDSHARVRPRPDLLGDLILEEACLDIQGKPTAFSSQLLERVFEQDARTAMANCADIGQLFGGPDDVDLVSKLALERARTVVTHNRSAVTQLLRSCQPLTVRRPLTVVEVATILESRGILRRDSPARELLETDSIEMKGLDLMLSAAEADPTAVPAALALGRDLYVSALPDEQASQHVRELLDSACRFATDRTVAHCRAAVQTQRAWVQESNTPVAMLAASLSGRFLRLDLQGHAEPLRAVPDVWDVRDIAVDTVLRGLSQTEASIQCASVEALELYARCNTDSVRMPVDSWQPQMAREVSRLCDALIKLVKDSPSLPVRACVELQGWLWWARELDVLHRAGATVLESVPDSDAYRLWKSLYAPRLPVRTVIPTDCGPGGDARLHHVESLATVRETQAPDLARELFDTLDPKQADANAWRTLWLNVLEQTPASRIHSRADATLAEFARRHPSEAWSLTEPDAKGALFAIVPMLLLELRKQDPVRASRAAREVLPGSRLEAAWFHVLWSVRDLNEFESELLARGLGSTDPETMHRAAEALLGASDIDRVGAFRRVFAALTQHPADEPLWTLVIEHFVHWTEGLLPRQTATLTPTEPMAQVADGLITLFKTQSSHIRWGYQRYTRQLPEALAILAILQPRRLEEWMRQTWGQSGRAIAQWEDENPLSIRRLRESTVLLRASPDAAGWIEICKQWM